MNWFCGINICNIIIIGVIFIMGDINDVNRHVCVIDGIISISNFI